MDFLQPRTSILVVDDEPANIDLLTGILADDYEVRAAVDGQRALEAVNTARPDLILLDIMMPGLDGFEVCRRLKQNRRHKDIPIICITGKDDPEDERRMLELGAEDFITKPISPPVVLARIESRLELHQSRDTLRSMLQDTVLGSVNVFAEMLALTNVEAAGRARRIRRLVDRMSRNLGRDDWWQFDVAAVLSELGCMGLDEDDLARLYRGESMDETAEQREAASRYAEQSGITANMFAAIPHLKDAGSIVLRTKEPLGTDDSADSTPAERPLEEWDVLDMGALLLRVAKHYDQRYLNGESHDDIVTALRASPVVPPAVADALSGIPELDPEEQEVRIEHLSPGMVLAQDVYTRSGVRAMPKGFEITPSVLKHLRSFTNDSFGGHIRVYVFEQPEEKKKANPFDLVGYT